MSTPPTPAAPSGQTPGKKSNLLWWVLGLAGLAVLVICVSGLLVAHLFVKEIRFRNKTGQVEIETPAGQITMGETRARDVGLPIYPGATATQSGGGIEFTSMENERVGLTEVHLVSGDPLEKVDAWYRERLGPDFQHEGPGTKPGSIHLRGAKVRDEDIAFVSDRDDLVRVVALKRRGAGVEIALVRIGGRETQ
ncbi:MAG TPA: hypothetical protein VKE24_12725 [Candidatus Acidoferrales bacterium]|nr:hypothetical protein [Candidatus Acidoferrales bacterium]